MRLAFFGGIYNNAPALSAAVKDARRRGAEELYCLGDMGAFGPHPDRVFPILRDNKIVCIQGNYDHSIGNNLNDCRCGYTDPRDNHFAQISYDYTNQHTSDENRLWMRSLPSELRFERNGIRFLLCHGSPRRTNEFLWESNTSTHFLEKLSADHQADLILATHTGLHWERELADGRRFINVGVLGRPENDGCTNVWYTMVLTGRDTLGAATGVAQATQPRRFDLAVQFVPLKYDHRLLAEQMKQERLPEEFIETILTGWWTTCLEELPSKERRRGRF